MSDHPDVAERELKRIVICADICLDVFRWLSREKVGFELALVSCRFNSLVDTHLRSRRWAVGRLEIHKSTNGAAEIYEFKRNGSIKSLPIAQTPPPNGITGFERIKFAFISTDVIAFFRCIGRLLQSNIALVLDYSFTENEFTSMIWPLLNLSAIVKMESVCEIFSFRFRLPTFLHFLRNCANLRFVSVMFVYHSLRFASTDAFGPLCEWLHTPRDDGRPKVLRINFGRILMDQLKMEFLNASTGVNCIILCAKHFGSPFQLENTLTRERLTMRPIEDDRYDNKRWMVVRFPIDKDADQWAKWEREALENEFDWKVLQFPLCIG